MSKTSLTKFKQEAERILAEMRERATAFTENPDERETRVRRAKEDFLYFCSTYLPHYFSQPFDKPHFAWAQSREVRDEPVFEVGPPESGKSTVFEIADTLHGILYSSFRYGVIGCHSLDQAQDRVEFIKLELEENPRVLQDFGNLRGPRWERGDFWTANGIRLKGISFKTRIYGLTFKNWRPTYCRLSDVEDEKTVASVKITKKIRKWITDALIPRLAEGYSFVYNGNKLHPKMALVQLAEARDDDGKKKYQGQVWPLRVKGKCQFPHLWTQARIEKQERALGKMTFARVYDFQGLDVQARFKPEWFRTEPPEILIGVRLDIFGGMDPSPEPNEQQENCAKAIVLVGREPNGLYHTIDAWIMVASIGEFITAGYTLHDRWNGRGNFVRFLMKGTKVEELYRQKFHSEAIMRGRVPLPIDFQNESMNKIFRLGNRLPPIFETGMLRFVTQHGHVQRILDEAELFPDGGLDGLDALDMALQAADGNYAHGRMMHVIGGEDAPAW